LNCTTCARSTLYAFRIELAKSLLGKESVARQIEAITSGDISKVPSTTTLDGAIVDLRDCARSERTEAVLDELSTTNERIHLISKKAVKFKKEIEDLKKEMAEKRARIKSRRSDAESAIYKLDSRSTKELDHLDKNIRVMHRDWDKDYTKVMQARVALCRKAARLAGLRREKIYEDQTWRERFEIARLPIFDLRELNGADPEVLTASFTQVAYLLDRVSTYLAIRLPAEVRLPNKDHPQCAAILAPSSSYLTRESVPTLSKDRISPETERPFPRTGPRPRLLYLSKSLPTIQKEDPVAFSMFVEGATILAWNIAWLCKTQGMSGISSWTEICSVGKNLEQLLLADHRGVSKVASDHKKQKPTTSSHEEDKSRPANLPTHFGRYSHGSVKSFFKDGNEVMRGWRLSNPIKAIDKVKAHLIAEMQGAEWEVLDEGEWNDPNDFMGPEEQPVLVHGRKYSAAASEVGKTSKPGSTGWTRLRYRSDSANAVTKSGSTHSSQRT